MNNFEIFNETGDIVELTEVKNLIEYFLQYEKLKGVEFNIIVVDNNYIKRLNKQFRGLDSPTDVLSFALEDCTDIVYEDVRLLGDIYISIDQARSQAISYGHSLLRELSFLSVHGLLHLLGYDHMNAVDEKIMFDKQERILRSYGI
ncbi:MAG: rRNA maturation RNase YbeY [Bacilli bacterium]